jgi:hypothetical protein
MPICRLCQQEKRGHWYRRLDGARGFACLDEPCHTIGGRERQARLDLERAWREAARRRRVEARQLPLALEGGGMARTEIPWERLRALIQAQPPWTGAVGTWEAIGRALDVTRVLWSTAERQASERLDAVGFLPAVLVLPKAWRAVLPPVPEAWLIPTSESEKES